MAYEGALRRHENILDGAFQTDRGKTPIAAMRLGSAIIGTWSLEVASERGTRRQRLEIRRDLTGWYGAAPRERR